MLSSVKTIVDQVRSRQSDGRGGYLRIKPGADREKALAYLAEERDEAQAEVERQEGPTQLVRLSVPMQMLILTELLLAEPDMPVDIRAVAQAQGYGTGYVSERIEDAASALVMMAPKLLEAVAQL